MFSDNQLSPAKARRLFRSDKLTLEFIAGIKWKDGFVCRKCGNTNYCEGKTPYSRRCTRCKTEESATAHTLFHHCKFPVRKAFYIAYSVCVEGKEFSSYEYAEKLGIRQMTCWKFRKKILTCLQKKKKSRHTPSLAKLLLMEDKTTKPARR